MARLINREEAFLSEVLIRFVIAVLLVQAAQLLLNHLFVLLFEGEEGALVVVGVAVEWIDLRTDAIIGFGRILDDYFEVAVVLQEDIVQQALTVLASWWRLLCSSFARVCLLLRLRLNQGLRCPRKVWTESTDAHASGHSSLPATRSYERSSLSSTCAWMDFSRQRLRWLDVKLSAISAEVRV